MKQLLVGAAIALSAASALAQSSVTVYGIVDVFGQYLDGSSKTSRLQSGGQAGSRLGFKGAEDLGGGLKAFFTLESGFNADDGTLGQGGIMWGRQVFVGIGGQWGQLSAGRQYSSLDRMASVYSAFGNALSGPSTQTIGGFAGGYEPFRGAGPAASPPAAGATGNSGPYRVNNSIKYESPTWNGLTGSILVGLGEVAGGTNQNRLVNLEGRYTVEPVDVILFYISDKTNTTSGGSDVATTGLAGTYAFPGGWKAYAGYLRVDDKRPDNQDGRGWWLAGEYQWSRHTVRAQYLQSKPRFGNDNETKAIGIGYQYDFSKRTDIYTSLTRFKNGYNAGGGLGRFSAPVPAGLTTFGDNNITEAVLGIRHTF